MKKHNKNIKLIANDVEKIITRTQEEHKKDMDKIETLKNKIETLNKKTKILKR